MPENYTARWYKAESPANIPPAPSAMNEKDISKLYMWHVWRDEQYWKWKDMILLHWKGTQVEHNSFVLCSRLWRHESWPNKKALENAMSRVSHLQGSSARITTAAIGRRQIACRWRSRNVAPSLRGSGVLFLRIKGLRFQCLYLPLLLLRLA